MSMLKEIKIYKADQKKAYALGFICKENKKHYRIQIDKNRPCAIIRDGFIDNMPIETDFGEKISKESIVEQIYLQNKASQSVNARGWHQKKSYGNTWFLDYEPGIEPLFEKIGINVPEDKRSIAAKMTDLALGNVKSMYGAAPGQEAIEKAKAAQVENEKLKAELEAAKAALAAQEAKPLKAPKAKQVKSEK